MELLEGRASSSWLRGARRLLAARGAGAPGAGLRRARRGPPRGRDPPRREGLQRLRRGGRSTPGEAARLRGGPRPRARDDPSITVTRERVGSVHAMAPELIRGGAVDARADVYALGVLLYQLLTGELPFWSDDPVRARAAAPHRAAAAPRPAGAGRRPPWTRCRSAPGQAAGGPVLLGEPRSSRRSAPRRAGPGAPTERTARASAMHVAIAPLRRGRRGRRGGAWRRSRRRPPDGWPRPGWEVDVRTGGMLLATRLLPAGARRRPRSARRGPSRSARACAPSWPPRRATPAAWRCACTPARSASARPTSGPGAPSTARRSGCATRPGGSWPRRRRSTGSASPREREPHRPPQSGEAEPLERLRRGEPGVLGVLVRQARLEPGAGDARRRPPPRPPPARRASRGSPPGRARRRAGSPSDTTGRLAPVSSRSSRRAVSSGASPGSIRPVTGCQNPPRSALRRSSSTRPSSAERDHRHRAQVGPGVGARPPERLGQVQSRAGSSTSAVAGGRLPAACSSAARLVTPRRGSAMPHGTIAWKCSRSGRR